MGFILTYRCHSYVQRCSALLPRLQSGVRSTVNSPPPWRRHRLLPTIHKAPSAPSPVMTAMTTRGRWPPSARSQANGALHCLPAQVMTLAEFSILFVVVWIYLNFPKANFCLISCLLKNKMSASCYSDPMPRARCSGRRRSQLHTRGPDTRRAVFLRL